VIGTNLFITKLSQLDDFVACPSTTHSISTYPLLFYATDATLLSDCAGHHPRNRFGLRFFLRLRAPRAESSWLPSPTSPYSLCTMRRLIVCADGTWQSALFQDDPEKLTNISRIFTAINRQDTRQTPPIEQVKLYLPGVGTGEELMIGAVSVSFFILFTFDDTSASLVLTGSTP